ncbi:hypothetical protein PtB15_17B103 [Puccinia triticina]|nr:hypothetical protein PtB15_17B103 [Puccinia triticina]
MEELEAAPPAALKVAAPPAALKVAAPPAALKVAAPPAALKVAAPPAALPLFGSGKKREPATFSGSAAEPSLRYRFLTWPRSAPPLPAKKAQRSAKRSCFGGRCAALKGVAPSAALPLFGSGKKRAPAIFSGGAAGLALRYRSLG